MRYLLAVAIGLSGCASWHWEKYGTTVADYEVDERFCKQQAYSGTDGMVTKAHVQRMHDCLTAMGWKKVAN